MKQSNNIHFIDSIKKLGRCIEIFQLNEIDIKEIICIKYPRFAQAPNKLKIVEIILEICNALQMFSSLREIKSGGSSFDTNIFAKVKDVRLLSLRFNLELI